MSLGLTLAAALLLSSPSTSALETHLRADSVWTHKGVVVRMEDGPSRALEWELFVAAPVQEVWDAWVEPDGLTTWAGPGAFVDLRVGGAWEVHFEPDRPKGQRGSDANEVVAFEEGRFLHLKAGAPLEFPTIRATKTDFTVALEPAGTGYTRVLVRQLGWQDGEEWDRGFHYLAGANAEWLSWMVRRFVSGPLEWPGTPSAPATVRPGADLSFTDITGTYLWERTDSTGSVTGRVTDEIRAVEDGALERSQRFELADGSWLFSMTAWLDAGTLAPRRVHITAPSGVVGRIEFDGENVETAYLQPWGRPMAHSVERLEQPAFEWVTSGGLVTALALVGRESPIAMATVVAGPGTDLGLVTSTIEVHRDSDLVDVEATNGARWQARRASGPSLDLWVRDEAPYLVRTDTGSSRYVLRSFEPGGTSR